MRRFIVVLTIVLATACQAQRSAPKDASFEVLTGVVVRKEWSKSYESWNAGGSEYYVLAVDHPSSLSDKRTAREGVILRPSASVPFARFADFVGKRVECRGVFAIGAPYVPPKGEIEQAPLATSDPSTGKIEYPTRGSGFETHSIVPSP